MICKPFFSHFARRLQLFWVVKKYTNMTIITTAVKPLRFGRESMLRGCRIETSQYWVLLLVGTEKNGQKFLCIAGLCILIYHTDRWYLDNSSGSFLDIC